MKSQWFGKLLLVQMFGLLFSVEALSQAFTAGVNVDSPNPNAVLHLVSPNGNQGLLIPNLTTAQRTGMSLTSADNGMLVYDGEAGLFYFWLDPNWIALIVRENQRLGLVGTELGITGGNTVDLSALRFLTEESDPTVPDAIKDGIDWTELTGIPIDIADGDASGLIVVNVDGVTITGDGDAPPLSVNTGTGANQVVQLNGSSQLPAVDGSLLTGVAAAVAPNSIVDAQINAAANISDSKLQSTVMLETENVSLLTRIIHRPPILGLIMGC